MCCCGISQQDKITNMLGCRCESRNAIQIKQKDTNVRQQGACMIKVLETSGFEQFFCSTSASMSGQMASKFCEMAPVAVRRFRLYDFAPTSHSLFRGNARHVVETTPSHMIEHFCAPSVSNLDSYACTFLSNRGASRDHWFAIVQITTPALVGKCKHGTCTRDHTCITKCCNHCLDVGMDAKSPSCMD